MENIPLPKTIDVKEEGDHKAVITVSPCYPGYGVTLGNALRRVLLSSLPGAAITAVRIKNADHEFTSLPHVKEDVVSIILNLKSVRLRLQGDEPMTLHLKVKGEKVVKAKDFEVPSQVEIVNKDQVIATLTDPAGELDIEVTVNSGRGYVPVENREKEKRKIGTVAIDAIYTPVRTVNFDVTHVRVQQMTNFDQLLLTIETDGTVKPHDAFLSAAQILSDHFALLIGKAQSEDDIKVEEVAEEIAEPEVKKKKSKSAE